MQKPTQHHPPRHSPTRPLVSLKWRAIALTSLILLCLAVVLTYLSHSSFTRQFEERRLDWYDHQRSEIELALRRSSIELGRQASLLAALSPRDEEGDSTLDGLQRNLEAQWPTIQLTLDAHRLALFDASGRRYAYWGQEPQNYSPDWLQATLSRVLEEDEVITSIQCSSSCLQYAFTPILIGGESAGVLMINRSLADLTLSAQRATSDNVSLMIDGGIPVRQEELRYIPSWNGHLLTITNLEQTLPVLEVASSQVSIRELSEGSKRFNDGNRSYELFAMPLNEGDSEQAVGHLLVLSDITAEVRSIAADTNRLVIVMISGWLVAEALLLALLWRPMQRLRRLTQALPALATRDFARVRREIALPHARWPDEIDVLNHTALLITNRLAKLELDVEAHSAELAERIKELGRERDFVNRLLDTAEVLILLQNANGRITRVNRQAEQVTGIEAGALLGRDFAQVFLRSPEGGEEIDAHPQEALLEQPDLPPRVIAWYHAPLLDDSNRPQGQISVGIDVTERKHAERRLAWLANRDPLTQLYNRRYLEQALDRMIDQDGKGAVLFLDLDQFKEVNELSGHSSGDELLKRVAAALRHELEGQAVIARQGGDEFVLLVEGADEAKAVQVARRIEQALGAIEYYANGRRHRAIGSIGIALYPQHGATPVELLASADMAMYQAKESVHQRWHLLSALQAPRLALQQRVDGIERLRQALREERFVLELQPIVSLRGGSVHHYEALVRMVDEQGRLIQPGGFIPIAERCGLITEIDQWVMREGLALLRRLEPYGVHLAINLSAASLLDNRLLDRLDRMLATSGAPAERLTIEITETVAVTDIAQASRIMNGIRALGCKTALDDFGVGFSSFHHLRHLPTDVVKIDGSFIRQLATSHEDWLITKAITETALAFGKQVVAECVEDEETLKLLEKIGVTHAQGFYLGRPTQVSQLLARLEPQV